MSSNNKEDPVSGDLDQVLTIYREKLKILSSLWAGIASNGPAADISELLLYLERKVDDFIDTEIKVEKAKHNLVNLHQVMYVSTQAVESKSRHLDLEDKQKEEEQQVRFRDFQQIHRLQNEKAEIEKRLVPAKAKLEEIIDGLQERREKMRNLEYFHNALSQQCVDDIANLQEERDAARNSKVGWDSPSTDVGSELAAMAVNKDELSRLENNVSELRRDLYNHRMWHEEELQTKLFLSSRNKEANRKLVYLKDILRRIVNKDKDEDIQNMYNQNESDKISRPAGNLTDQFAIDGNPGVHAKQVEQYLSASIGARVLTDYTMLQKLREEIGAPGLAYLVEAVRLQGSGGGHGAAHRCMEERQIQQALKAIAREYRDRDENKRLMQVPGLADRKRNRGSKDRDLTGSSDVRGASGVVTPDVELSADPKDSSGSVSGLSHCSRDTGSNRSISATSTSSSILRRGSMKIKKLLKR